MAQTRLCLSAGWILLAALSVTRGEAFQQAPLEGVTGEPGLLAPGESDLMVGLPEEQYLKSVAPFVGRNIRNLLLMKKKPAALSANARFGSDFSLEREIRAVGW